jgi:hypothetical protein
MKDQTLNILDCHLLSRCDQSDEVNITVFWVVASCSLIEVHGCFTGACCLQHEITPMTEAPSISEITINLYQTTWCNNAGNSLYTCCHENPKSRQYDCLSFHQEKFQMFHNTTLLTTKFLDAEKFTTLTTLSLLVSYKLSF